MNLNNNKNELKSQLWKMACNLRGNMDAFEFKDYILGILCFRFLSEKFEKFLAEEQKLTLEEYKNYYKESKLQDILKEVNGFYLKPEEVWTNLINTINNKPDDFQYTSLINAFISIEETSKNTENHHVFNNLFSTIDLGNDKIGRTPEEKNRLLMDLMKSIDNFCPFHSYCMDVLGEIYEYLIGEFAASAGKKAGEFFTPIAVSNLMAQIVITDKDQINAKTNLTIYDPACGSGSLLLQVISEIKNRSSEGLSIKANHISIYGQELNNTTYNLARMNILMHSIDYFQINLYAGNTLTNFFREAQEHPHRKIIAQDGGFNIIVANPPYSQKWRATPNENHFLQTDERFSGYPALAPKQYADWAFVQHMLYCLSDQGICAVVLPHGVLFRGNSEYLIRKHILQKKYLETVIGLPPNIFYGTGIATCILIFKKCRKDDQHILFIDAAHKFIAAKNKNMINEQHIKGILDLYIKRQTINQESYLASKAEIEKNDYNLNISLYVHKNFQQEEIDIQAVEKNIAVTTAKIKELNQKINNYIAELLKNH